MGCRAIHIEVADSLNTDSFLNALRRFVAIRGPIRQLRCDQGANFIGAKNELKAALNEMNQDQVRNFLLKENCDFFSFQLNVPSASHMGGVWERQIRTVRNILNVVIDQADSRLNDDSLRTLMYEVTASIAAL